jgi:hypothetical protein
MKDLARSSTIPANVISATRQMLRKLSMTLSPSEAGYRYRMET